MARPKAFDEDEVLERAMRVFWARGYERTSVQDLVDTMGIQRGSLYATFGDKHQLFLQALDRYEGRFYDSMTRLLAEAASAEAGIRSVFEQVLTECACDDDTKGCFITNTAVALAQDDAETAARIRANLKRMEGAFEETLVAALARGEIAASLPPRKLARFLTNALQGLRVLSKSGVHFDVLQDVVQVTLSVLNKPALLVGGEKKSFHSKGEPYHG